APGTTRGTLTTTNTAALSGNGMTLQRNWVANKGFNATGATASLDVTDQNAGIALTLGAAGASTVNTTGGANITGSGTIVNNSTLQNAGAGLLTIGNTTFTNNGTLDANLGSVTITS